MRRTFGERWRVPFGVLSTASEVITLDGLELNGKEKENQGRHPCFDCTAVACYGRIHLPVALDCNIKCRYCDRRYGCVNENRPGVACRVLTPREALAWTRQVLLRDPRITVVGIAGPGDPLGNPATWATLALVHQEFPTLIKCVSTNGLALPGYIARLKEVGVRNLTVTVNAVDPVVGAKIYAYVCWEGKFYRGEAAASLLWERQAAGIEEAVRAGLRVKVNTVFIPGVNDTHLPAVARAVASLGAHLMNVVPLIPLADFAHLAPPAPAELARTRAELEAFLPQMNWCRQCRADAVGLLGEETAEHGGDLSLSCGGRRW